MKFLCDYEIIDFHTHPFIDVSTNICAYRHHYDMDKENILETMKSFGISKTQDVLLPFLPYSRFGSQSGEKAVADLS